MAKTPTKARAKARRRSAPPAARVAVATGGCTCQACACPFDAQGWRNQADGRCWFCARNIHHRKAT